MTFRDGMQFPVLVESGNAGLVSVRIRGENIAIAVNWNTTPTETDIAHFNAAMVELMKPQLHSDFSVTSKQADTLEEQRRDVEMFLGPEGSGVQ